MDVTEVLIVLEMNQVIGFSTYGHFSLARDFNNCSMSWSFNDGESKNASNNAGLKLVASHFDDHIMIDDFSFVNFDEGSSGTSDIFQVESTIFKFDLCMVATDTFI